MEKNRKGKDAWFSQDPSKRKKRRFGGLSPQQTIVREDEQYNLLLQELTQELESAIADFETQHGYTPSLSELSSYANISVDRILQVLPEYEQEQPETEREETHAADLLYADEFLDAAEAYLTDWQRKVRRIYFQYAAQDVKTTAGILGISEDEVYEVFATSNEVLSEVSMRMRHGTFSSQAPASSDSSHTGVEHILRGYNSHQIWELRQQLPLLQRNVLRLLLEGKKDVHTLSNATGIPRQKILEILPELQEMLANMYEPEEEDAYPQNWWQRWWRKRK